jgi:hypothetical protein
MGLGPPLRTLLLDLPMVIFVLPATHGHFGSEPTEVRIQSLPAPALTLLEIRVT